MHRAWVILFLLGALVGQAAARDESPIAPFVGKYRGEYIKDSGGELTQGDSAVTIEPRDEGFVVEWISVTRRADGRLKRKVYSIPFRPTQRSRIFTSAMRTNLFGRPVPLDPLQGDPYVWARIEDRTLTVYALIITDDGAYEMQKYERTLIEGGLELKFSRLRDGEPMRTATGVLKRVEGSP